MSAQREDFVRRFGADQADAVEAAAFKHRSECLFDGNEGSDPFRCSILMCISFECMEVERYRQWHGITAEWADIDAWLVSNGAWLMEHEGYVDALALFCGAYDKYQPKAMAS